MTLQQIQTTFNTLCTEILTINRTSSYTQTTQNIIDLCGMINTFCHNNDDTESLWWLESDNTGDTLDSLITGAYWHFSDWHAGQNSKGYEALSQLGTIYTPNMETVDTENLFYVELDNFAKSAITVPQ